MDNIAHMATQISQNLLNNTTSQYLLPAGCMLDFAGNTAPTGFLLCDGNAVNRTTYAALFNVIGTTWGVGNGTTTFNVPDFRRRTAVGSGGTGTATLGNALGNIGGAETHTLTTSELAAHNHGVTDSGHTHGAPRGDGGGLTGGYYPNGDSLSYGVLTSSSTTGISINNAGSGSAHNNVQPSAVVTKIIKT